MKHVWRVFSPSPAQTQSLLWWAVGLIALPLALFVWWTVWQAPSRMAELRPVSGVEVWHEPIGKLVFDQASLEALVRRAPDLSRAQWTPVQLPHHIELGQSIDLPPDAPKQRAWFRIPIPPPQQGDATHGRLGLLGLRIQAGGPWSFWADGRLIQSNLADWRIQWNVPLRMAVPLDARELLLAVPYAQPQGFSVGSILIGPVDTVDSAWLERNFWHMELARFSAAIAALLALVSFHLAWSRRREPLFLLLGLNAVIWSVTCIQWAFDTTGQDRLSVWLGSAVDSSICWTTVLVSLFAFESEGIRAPRLRTALLLYAAGSTLLTLPLWAWQKNALMAQQSLNVVTYVICLGVLGWRLWRQPRREAVVIFSALLLQLGLGMHTLFNLTNQTNPDSFYSFPLSTVVLYLAFMYVLGRRTVVALDTSERHEVDLREQLADQKHRLATQHALLQRMAVERSLTHQHETIMQDLHDRLGSNLTSALLQARQGQLTPQETVLLLQDLAEELRHIGHASDQAARGLNDILAELRERVQHRLSHGGIALDWAVDLALPPLQAEGSGRDQHLTALLSEAIANVIKHAGASRIRIEAKARDGAVVISLSDDGRGFDPAVAAPGRGLPGMRQRARSIGAMLRVASAPGQGCRWQLTLPAAQASGPLPVTPEALGA